MRLPPFVSPLFAPLLDRMAKQYKRRYALKKIVFPCAVAIVAAPLIWTYIISDEHYVTDKMLMSTIDE
jgi:hypothetical protein